jgi:hypothetical protein
MTLLDAIRDRCLAISAQAQTVAEVLSTADTIDLPSETQTGLLAALDALAVRLEDVTERLSAGVDPSRLRGTAAPAEPAGDSGTPPAAPGEAGAGP